MKPRYLIGTVLFLLPALAQAQYTPYRTKLLDTPSGAPMQYALVTVCDGTASLLRLPCSPTSTTIYSDTTGTVKANPFRTDALGNLEFYDAPGTKHVVSITAVITPGYSFIVEMPYTASGSLVPSSLNNIIFVDGVTYPTIQAAVTACGSNSACGVVDSRGHTETISSSITFPKPMVLLLGNGTYTGTCPLFSIRTGSVTIQGIGLDNTGGTGIATALQCTNTGQDVISVLGTVSNRISHVILRNLFVLGSGTSRYGLRFEKVDQVTVEDSAFFNHGTANVYGVDSTGDTFINDRIANIPANGMVLDWGTGQFSGDGLVFESLVCNTAPMLTIQGSGSGQSFHGLTMQLDGCTSTWGGFVSVTGFDTNSSFAGAPTGGAGAPVGPGFYNLNTNMSTNGGNSSQGADVLVSGTAANNTQDVVFVQPQIFGSNFSTVAFKFDRSKGSKVVDGFSNGHATGTFNVTSNALYSQAYGLTTLDTAVCAGTCPSGIAILNSQTSTGRWDMNNGYVSGDGLTATPAWSFSLDTGNGFSRPGNNYLRYSSGGADILSFGTTGQILASGKSYAFATGDSYSSTLHPLWVNTAPTILTHFNTSGDSVSASNGTAAFTVTVGTGTAGSTGAVTLPAAATGWVCNASNRNRGAYIQQTGSSTTSATFTNYGTTVGTPVNWTNSDVLGISCSAY